MDREEAVIDTTLNAEGVEQGARQVERALSRMSEKASQSARKTAESMDRVIKSASFDPSEEYAQLEAELSKLDAKLESLVEKQIRFVDIGGSHESMAFKGMEYDIDRIRAKMDEIRSKMQSIDMSDSVSESMEQEGEEAEIASRKVNLLAGSHDKLSHKSGRLKKMLANVVSGFLKMNRALKGSNKHFGQGFKNILKYTLGIRSLFVLINKIRGAIVDGFKNLAQFNGGINPVNESLSRLKSGLTQLKNSFATAFAPLLSIVEPVLLRIISVINKTVTAIGMLIATLTGQKTFIQAVGVQEDYAEALDKTGKSAKKAKNSISQLDELNLISQSSDAGGSAGGINPSDMFKEVDIPDKFKNLADWLKKMWEDADFTELGALIGQKLKDALDSIPWDEIQENGRKLGKSFATLINGFVEVDGLGTSIGNTIGEALNTAIYTAEAFVKNLHWESVGKFFADGLNGMIFTIDWKALGDTLSTSFKGLFDMISATIENTDWDALGHKIVECLCSIDWLGAISSFLRTIASIVDAIERFLYGLLSELFTRIASGLSEYFQPFIDEATENGKSVASGILKGIWEGFKDIGRWVVEHIFTPFINAFRGVFGIHSPSTVMAEQGEYIMQGLKNGITAHIAEIVNKFVELKEKFVGKIREMKDEAVKKFAEIKTDVSSHMASMSADTLSKLDKLKTNWTSTWQTMRSTVEDVVAKVKDKFGGLFDDLDEKMKKTSKALTGGLGSIASGVANVGGRSFSNSSVPHLASGTVVPRSASQFMAVLGDNNRETEVVSPLSTMKQAFIEAMAEGGFGGNGEVNVNVYLEGDAGRMLRVVRTEARNFEDRTNNKAFA